MVSLFLGRQLSTFHEKAMFFSSGKYFAHIYFNVGYCLLKRNVSPVTVEGVLKVLSCDLTFFLTHFFSGMV